jgi:hypothetical protein
MRNIPLNYCRKTLKNKLFRFNLFGLFKTIWVLFATPLTIKSYIPGGKIAYGGK